MKYFLIIIFLLSLSCTPKKQVYICGDRECVNKKEAKRYFEENLSFEVKIIEKKKKDYIDLVHQNKRSGEKKIIPKEKDNNKDYLSKSEKKAAKKYAKLKEKENKKAKKKALKLAKKKERENKKKIVKLKKNKKMLKKKIKKENISNKIKLIKNSDFCLTNKKCDIDEIAEHFNQVGSKKPYPNISN